MKKFFNCNKIIQSQILFDIYFNYSCNYNCYYCYSKKNNLKISDKQLELIINFFKRLNNITLPNLKILGGEPLLYDKLFYFIDSIYEFSNYYVDLTTNFSLLNDKNIDLLNNYKTKNFRIELSIHPQYINEQYLKHFFNIISKLKININIIVNLDLNYKNQINDFIKLLNNKITSNVHKNYSNINIIYNPIIFNGFKNDFKDFDIDFNDRNENLNHIYMFGNKKYSFTEIYNLMKKKYKFNFKNKVFCDLKYFSIYPENQTDTNVFFQQQCTNKLFTEDKILNTINNKSFFTRCSSDFCDYSCYFDLNKIFMK